MLENLRNRMKRSNPPGATAGQAGSGPVQTPAATKPHKPPCEFCGDRDSEVTKTVGERRYRRCKKCGRNFTTVEVVQKSSH